MSFPINNIAKFFFFCNSAPFVFYLINCISWKKNVVKFIESKREIEILAIGIGHDVSRYYNKAIKITDVQELGDVMIGQLSGLFDNKKRLH